MVNFKAVIKINSINPYIKVSKVRATLIKSGWRKPLPVIVQINGEPKKGWRINMMPAGDGSFYLYLNGIVRKASQTKVGDRVEAELTFDSTYKSGPAHAMPKDLENALIKNPKAKKAWEDLIPSRKKEVLRYLATLKSQETLNNNITKVLFVLSGNEGRFMARTWKDGK